MALLYIDVDVLDLEWVPHLDPSTICHDLTEYINSADKNKIALTIPAWESFLSPTYKQQLDILSKASDKVFVFLSELWGNVDEIIHEDTHDNVYWLVPGASNIKSTVLTWADWFKTTSAVYKQLPEKLNELNFSTAKPKYFDALLGYKKPHRDYIADSIVQHDLQDKILLNYGIKKSFIFEPGTELLDPNYTDTATMVMYNGVKAKLSQIIPLDIYNQTAYSMIAETVYLDSSSFFTEKTAKPLIARRLFVVFSGYKFLHNLRNLGFKTFGSVINESYDTLTNSSDRWSAAFDQVKYLCNQDQQSILDAVKETVDYNHNLIMDRNWTKWAAKKINEISRN